MPEDLLECLITIQRLVLLRKLRSGVAIEGRDQLFRGDVLKEKIQLRLPLHAQTKSLMHGLKVVQIERIQVGIPRQHPKECPTQPDN